jgi:hypothetical protein
VNRHGDRADRNRNQDVEKGAHTFYPGYMDTQNKGVVPSGWRLAPLYPAAVPCCGCFLRGGGILSGITSGFRENIPFRRL